VKRIVCCGLLSIAYAANLVSQQVESGAQESRIAQLIDALHEQSWPGARYMGNPTWYMFQCTEPMEALLKIGPPAQQPLLEKLSDTRITDQIVILLGGVGDERSVGPIIDAMKRASSNLVGFPRSKIMSAGNLALTNITVADTIWHHGGGFLVDACPDDPVGCWDRWWQRNEATFHVRTVTQSRRYSNYPNYGIYSGLP
jgi:hypothetical protein